MEGGGGGPSATGPASASDAALRPATVVIEQRVHSSREKEFRLWHNKVNLAVASFAGFLGTELVPPDEGGDKWSVIYRFDSTVNLETWLHSAVRRKLLEEGAALFTAPASQLVLAADTAKTATVVVSHRVHPASEEEFLEWQERVTEAERGFAGFRGSELLRSVAGVQPDWLVVYRFDSDEHLDDWLNSPERERLLAEGKKFRSFALQRMARPFGNWFSLPDDAPHAPPPSSWKSALSVLVGLY